MSIPLFPADASPRDVCVRDAIEALIRAGRQHHRLIEQRVEELGLHRSQHHLLMAVARMGRTASQKAIADRMGITPAAVARTLKTLEAEGLIEKADGADGRRNEISVLPAGQRTIEKTHRMFHALDLAVFDGIPDAELAAMTATLRRMLDNIARMEAENPQRGEDSP